MSPLTLFGLFAVSAMLLCYALEQRSRWFILGFAGACALGSAYGFLQGAWPFGVVEAVWSVVAVSRWLRARRAAERRRAPELIGEGIGTPEPLRNAWRPCRCGCGRAACTPTA